MNPLVVNLLMGVFWLFLAAGILTAEALSGPLGYRPLGISVGWWALVLSLYNWLKVGLHWSGILGRKKMVTDWEEQRTTLARRESREKTDAIQKVPDPNFQFTDAPPKPDEPPK